MGLAASLLPLPTEIVGYSSGFVSEVLSVYTFSEGQHNPFVVTSSSHEKYEVYAIHLITLASRLAPVEAGFQTSD
jgi:hypothetical protein